jgi:hypothetical protein
MRVVLGILYIPLGLAILIRACIPLNTIGFSRVAPIVLGAAVAGLGVVRIREYLLMRKKVSS